MNFFSSILLGLAMAVVAIPHDVVAKEHGFKPLRAKPLIAPAHSKLNGQCNFMGCTEIFTMEYLPDTFDLTGCGITHVGFVQETITFTRNTDGTYTVTKMTAELVVECPPI